MEIWTYFPCPAGSHSMPFILLSCIKLAEFEKPGICKYPNPIIQKSLQKLLSPFQYFSRCYFLWAKLLQFSWIYTAYCASKVKAELGKFPFMKKVLEYFVTFFNETVLFNLHRTVHSLREKNLNHVMEKSIWVVIFQTCKF